MAVDMFIKIDGVEGESKISGHEGEIDVLAWNWGMRQAGSMHHGGGGGTGKADIQDLTFTHYVDKASGNLMLYCANGRHIPTAVLKVRKAGETPLEYIIITMTDCIVTSISNGGGTGEERLTENVTLNFAKVKFEYMEQASDGTGKPGPEFSWDIEKNEPV